MSTPDVYALVGANLSAKIAELWPTLTAEQRAEIGAQTTEDGMRALLTRLESGESAPTIIVVDGVPLSSCCQAELGVQREVGPDTAVYHAARFDPAEGDAWASLQVSFVKTYDATDSGSFEVTCGECGQTIDSTELDIEETW